MLINDVVVRLIQTDGDFRPTNDNLIKKTYENANENEKAILDKVFVNLTGFSLNSIVNKAEEVQRICEE